MTQTHLCNRTISPRFVDTKFNKLVWVRLWQCFINWKCNNITVKDGLCSLLDANQFFSFFFFFPPSLLYFILFIFIIFNFQVPIFQIHRHPIISNFEWPTIEFLHRFMKKVFFLISNSLTGWIYEHTGSYDGGFVMLGAVRGVGIFVLALDVLRVSRQESGKEDRSKQHWSLFCLPTTKGPNWQSSLVSLPTTIIIYILSILIILYCFQLCLTLLNLKFQTQEDLVGAKRTKVGVRAGQNEPNVSKFPFN